MRTIFKTLLALTALVFILQPQITAQSGRSSKNGSPVKKAEQAEGKPIQSRNPDGAKENTPDPDAIKLDTTLVVVPVIASDRSLIYIPDMRRDEFTIYEDGVEQKVVFFATIKEPFHVVLMLDTSGSTQEKLGEIQRAAKAFVEQLQLADRVKVISFDDEIRDLGEFTNDRAALRAAIEKTRPGKGTKLYDAVHLALAALREIEGRKAIVMFTDGVDMTSDTQRSDDNLQAVEESGVIVYPIRYDTRRETEALARRQNRFPTDPGVDGNLPPPVPGEPRGPRDPRVPIPPVIVDRPPTRYPDDGYPGGNGRRPDGRAPDGRNPGRFPDPSPPDTRPYPTPRGPTSDPITVMLDREFAIADQYLNQMALVSGGKLHRADTLASLPAAFARIADELRTQYGVGYYPTNSARDGSYRKIQIKTSRKNVVLRSRPGYRASSNGV